MSSGSAATCIPRTARQKLAEVLQMYAWHCRHHVAHVTELRKRMGW